MAAGTDTAARLRYLALGGLTALLIATPLLPGESAAELGTGCVLIMGGFVLAAMVAIVSALLGNTRYRLDWPDAGVVAVIACFAVSAWFTADHGNPRATINAAWQWGSFGLLFVLVRQLVRTGTESRAICVAMLALAAAISALAFYQYFVTMPTMRAQYVEDPERVLRDAGVEAAPESPERKLFEDRLNSTEPTATFALTNSLAGFLTPWLVLASGIGWRCWKAGARLRPCLVGACLCALTLGFCLLLTKSRTGVLASGAGLLAIGWGYLRGVRRIDWRIPLAAFAVLAVLIGAAAAAGAFDWLILSETPKSVLYRLEYWQATLSMIADHPWLGCGPGNFQQYYAFYKLPQASETIADPHNFLLEIWATGGTAAAAAMVCLLGLLVWRGGLGANLDPRGEGLAAGVALNGERDALAAGAALSGERDGLAAGGALNGSGAIWLGALAGGLFAFPAGMLVGFAPPQALVWVGLPCAAAVVWLLRRWVSDGNLAAWPLLIAVLALLLNLSAAGGIGFAGVAFSFWLLAALLVNHAESGARSIELPRWAGLTLGAIGLLLVFACHQSMYAPVLTAQAKIGEGLAFGAQGRLELAEASLKRAAEADPASGQAWAQLAALYHMQLLSQHSPSLQARFDEAVRQAEQRNRRSFAFQRQLGDWRLAIYRRWGNENQLTAAIEAYRSWVQLYPNSNLGHAQLAWSYHLVGESEAASSEAAEALRLDAVIPHKERRLAEQQVYDPHRTGLPAGDAEQLMQYLRKVVRRQIQAGTFERAPLPFPLAPQTV